jgi:hypothetical protein
MTFPDMREIARISGIPFETAMEKFDNSHLNLCFQQVTLPLIHTQYYQCGPL